MGFARRQGKILFGKDAQDILNVDCVLFSGGTLDDQIVDISNGRSPAIWTKVFIHETLEVRWAIAVAHHRNAQLLETAMCGEGSDRSTLWVDRNLKKTFCQVEAGNEESFRDCCKDIVLSWQRVRIFLHLCVDVTEVDNKARFAMVVDNKGWTRPRRRRSRDPSLRFHFIQRFVDHLPGLW